MTLTLGTGEYQYRVNETWANLPDGWEFRDVAGVAVDDKDNVYIFNRGEHPMMIFDQEGNFLRSWGEGLFVRAHGLHIGPDQSIYCTDDGDHTVRKCTLDGKVLLEIGIPGKPTSYMSGEPFHRCTHTALSPDDHIFVSDGYGNSRVHKYTPDGKLVMSWGEPGTDPGQFNIVHNIAMDDSGLLYVADRENHRVQIFDQDGNFVNQIVNMHRPCTVTIFDNKLYVGELGYGLPVNKDVPNIGPRISLYSLDGKLINRWGEGFGLGEMELMAPHGLTVDNDNNIYLAEVCVAVLSSLPLFA